MTNIFISYNRKSEAATKALAEDLEALGHSVWFDQELSGGQAWWDQILSMVRRCDLFVFVLAPESLASAACKREYGYAVELGKPILPVLVSDGVNINLLPPALSRIQFVDYKQMDRGAAFRLARAVSAVPPPPPLPDPLPTPPEVPISYLGTLTEKVETSSSLTYEQQTTLVVDLKRGLRDPAHADDSRHLLERLRRRRDLFATVAEEIDEMLGAARQAEAAPPPAPKVTPYALKRSPSEETLPTPAGEALPEKQASPHANYAHATNVLTGIVHKTTKLERLKAAGLLAILGAVAGIIVWSLWGFDNMYEHPTWYLFPLGGAVAGTISGMNRAEITAALIGMLATGLLVSNYVFPIKPLALTASLMFPCLAVLAYRFAMRQPA